MSYSVNLWQTHPDLGNDDCSTGKEGLATLDEARAFIVEMSSSRTACNCHFAEIVHPDGTKAVEDFKCSHAPYPDDEDDGAAEEFANQQGMAFGIDAANEARGFGR